NLDAHGFVPVDRRRDPERRAVSAPAHQLVEHEPDLGAAGEHGQWNPRERPVRHRYPPWLDGPPNSTWRSDPAPRRLAARRLLKSRRRVADCTAVQEESSMAGITLLTHALLIDGTGREPVEGAAVVVEGSLIKDVVPSGHVGPLAGSVTTLDL